MNHKNINQGSVNSSYGKIQQTEDQSYISGQYPKDYSYKNNQYLKDHELDLTLKKSVQREREILTEILSLLKEVYRRRLFLKFGHSSLFAYLTEGIGYSAASAMRRIDAMKLSLEIPEVSQKIEKGELSLAQVSEIQKASREFKKVNREQLKSNPSKLTQTKIKAVQELIATDHANQKTMQKIVAQAFNLPLMEHTVQKLQKDESVRIELTLTKEQYAKLEKAKALLSHIVPDGDLRSLIEYLSDKVIAQKAGGKSSLASGDKSENVHKPKSLNSDDSKTLICDQPVMETKPRPIKIMAPPKKLYRSIFQKHSTCQHKDSQTQKVCGSAWKLQIEHLKPRWAGGMDEGSNLTVFCAVHNQNKYRQQVGIAR